MFGCKKRVSIVAKAPTLSPSVSVPTPEPDVPSPTVEITASPNTIERGKQTTLKWKATYATSVIIDAGVGNVSEKGQLVVSPLESTTYTATATGTGGETKASTRVTVVMESPSAFVSVTDIEELQKAINEGHIRPIFFDYDRAILTPKAKAILKENARWIGQFVDAKLIIEGHCDERGTEEYNLALGDRRAQAARNYLVQLGIASDRLMSLSFGEERPFTPGHAENAWRLNRRAHFVVQH